MIRVERLPLPESLEARLARERERVRRVSSLQERQDFRSRAWNGTRTVLRDMFRFKCAYCESRGSDFVSHLRPKARVRQRVKRNRHGVDDAGYWWLAYEWENLYLSCATCSQIHKRGQFPLAGERAEPGTKGSELRRELPLLLDPCHDQPELWLEFLDDGTVLPRTPPLGSVPPGWRSLPRGDLTIEVLGLNREALVVARQSVTRSIDLAVEAMQLGAGAATGMVKSLCASDAPYSMHATMVAGRRLEYDLDEMREFLGARRLSEDAYDDVDPPSWVAPDAELVDTELLEGSVPVFVTSIDLRNIKSLEAFRINIDPLAGENATWTMFLGENATGKSTIQQAVALALMGPDRLARRDDIDAAKWLTHGKRVGHIRVGLTGINVEDVDVEVTRSGFEFVTFRVPPMILRGYGPTRLLPWRGHGGGIPDGSLRVENVFDPRAALVDVDAWFLTLPRERPLVDGTEQPSVFDLAARTVHDVLPRTRGADLAVDDGGVRVPIDGRPHSLDQLSGGYQSVLGLATDIMAGIPPDELTDMHDVQGVVLLDEIGAHLHPRWQLRVISDLREAFPKLQFLATTHEPLCLHGLRETDRVAVLREHEPRVTVFGERRDDPHPASMRADQLLTSRFFGLHSTLSPEVDAKFQEYYDLLALEERNPEQAKRREELRRDLSRHGVLGSNPRDQVLYDVIDNHLVEARGTGRLRLDSKTRQEIWEMWQELDVPGELFP
ncbi:AAA family ATPase [Planctomycetota bacterium]|nr:AAA family ATPase [Planctomycetota bacterium]